MNKGLYVVSGSISLVPKVEDVLCQFLGCNQEQDQPPFFSVVYWIDSGNYFNSYQMAEMARCRGLDSAKVLKSLKIARPFTAFQLQQMLEKIPLPSTEYCVQTSAVIPAVPLVVISDLMNLFYDPELEEMALKRAFREFLTKLMRLKRHAVVLALLIERNSPPNRAFLLPRFLEMADRIQTLKADGCTGFLPAALFDFCNDPGHQTTGVFLATKGA